MPQLQLPPEAAGLWQGNPALLTGRMKFHICLYRTNLQKSSGKQPLPLAEMCVPVPSLLCSSKQPQVAVVKWELQEDILDS